jgi:prepilin-type N-terminal cleavage/methylation domain-containing protein
MIKRNNGFTLVEMIVVIAIMAIVSAIAVPNFYSYAAGMKLRSASRDLFSTLQNTRMNAISKNTRWTVEFPSSSSYRVVDCGPDNDCSVNNVYHSTTNISQYSGITASGVFPITFEFTSEGTCNAGTITFTDPKHKTLRVDVSPSGRIRIL